jgi:hypothetical protein
MGKSNGDMRAALERNRAKKPDLEIVEPVPESHNQRSSRAAVRRWRHVILRWTHSDNLRCYVLRLI